MCGDATPFDDCPIDLWALHTFIGGRIEDAMTETSDLLNDMNDRSREVFRRVVEGYLANGDPVGSRTLSKLPGLGVSSATVRNVMSDLEELGLITAPHTSAGRIPTSQGYRLFVDSMIKVSTLTETVVTQLS